MDTTFQCIDKSRQRNEHTRIITKAPQFMAVNSTLFWNTYCFFGKTAVYIHVKHHLHISHQVGHSERGESALWGYPKALQHGWQDPQLDAATSSHPQTHLQTLSCGVRTSPETTALKDSLLTEHHATSNTNTQHTISAQPLLIFWSMW